MESVEDNRVCEKDKKDTRRSRGSIKKSIRRDEVTI